MPFCHIRLTGRKPPSAAYPRHLRALGDHLRNGRLDLGLPQRDVAEQVGVTEASVYNWENNRSSPTLRFLPRILAFLGYDPYDAQATTLGERIVAVRRKLGLSHKGLARRLDVDASTLSRWERGRGKPSKRCHDRLLTFLADQPLDSRKISKSRRSVTHR